MEIRQLKYFISAATRLNFTKAAQECFVVPTAMTQQIGNLEKELDVKLFQRQPRGLVLTPAGKAFLQEAREIVARIELAGEKVQAFQKGYDSLLRVGYQGEVFKGDLAELLRMRRQENPNGKVELYQFSQAQLLSKLREGKVDLGLTPYSAYFDTETWMAMELLDEEDTMLVVAKDHPLAQRESVDVQEIRALPMVHFGQRGWETWSYLMNREGLSAEKNDILARDHSSLEILIESGYGAGVWPERMCRGNRYPNLRFLKIQGIFGKRRHVMIWRQGDLSSTAAEFGNQVREYFQKN